MSGQRHLVRDILPGSYYLADVVEFSDLPPLLPNYTVVKGCYWIQVTLLIKYSKTLQLSTLNITLFSINKSACLQCRICMVSIQYVLDPHGKHVCGIFMVNMCKGSS